MEAELNLDLQDFDLLDEDFTLDALAEFVIDDDSDGIEQKDEREGGSASYFNLY